MTIVIIAMTIFTNITEAAHRAYERAVCEAKQELDYPWHRAPAEAFADLGLCRLDWPEFLLGWVDAEERANERGSVGVDFYDAPPAGELLTSKGLCSCGHDDLDHQAACAFCDCGRFVRARGNAVRVRRPNAARPLSIEGRRRIAGAQQVSALARAAGIDF